MITDSKVWEMKGFIANEKQISLTVLFDSDNKVERAYGVRGVPDVFFLDKEGKLKSRKGGYDSKKEKETLEKYSKIIEEIL